MTDPPWMNKQIKKLIAVKKKNVQSIFLKLNTTGKYKNKLVHLKVQKFQILLDFIKGSFNGKKIPCIPPR